MKKLLALLLALTLVFALVACGPQSDPQPDEDPNGGDTPVTNPFGDGNDPIDTPIVDLDPIS